MELAAQEEETDFGFATGQFNMLYEPDPVWQCATCGRMAAETTKPAKCRQCGAGGFRGFDVREEMVRLAERDGCDIEVVEEIDLLMLYGGAGCLLRYRLPTEYIGQLRQGRKRRTDILLCVN